VERKENLSEYLRCDIGCGHRATGTVNIDPYPQKSIHRMTTDGVYHECKYYSSRLFNFTI
jgi:hypothetical protein